MLTDGVTVPVTVIGIAFDVDVAGDAQANDEVITTVTTSLLAVVVVWYVALLVPTLLPFTFHCPYRSAYTQSFFLCLKQRMEPV